jgi:hypothetical protein
MKTLCIFGFLCKKQLEPAYLTLHLTGLRYLNTNDAVDVIWIINPNKDVDNYTSRDNLCLCPDEVFIGLSKDCKTLLCNPKYFLNDVLGLRVPQVVELLVSTGACYELSKSISMKTEYSYHKPLASHS